MTVLCECSSVHTVWSAASTMVQAFRHPTLQKRRLPYRPLGPQGCSLLRVALLSEL